MRNFFKSKRVGKAESRTKEFKDCLVGGLYSVKNTNYLIELMKRVDNLVKSKTTLIPYYSFGLNWYGAKLAAKYIYVTIDKYGVPRISDYNVSFSADKEKMPIEEIDEMLSNLMTYDEIIKYANIGKMIALDREGKRRELEEQNEKIAIILECNNHNFSKIS